LLYSRPSWSPHAVKSRSRHPPDIGPPAMGPPSPTSTHHRNSRSIQMVPFNLQAHRPWGPQQLHLLQQPRRRRSQREIIRTEFPFLAKRTWWKVLIHLANISMWQDSLRERKLKIRTRIKSSSFRNWVALSAFEADAGCWYWVLN
jgi:hypothetical protein